MNNNLEVEEFAKFQVENFAQREFLNLPRAVRGAGLTIEGDLVSWLHAYGNFYKQIMGTANFLGPAKTQKAFSSTTRSHPSEVGEVIRTSHGDVTYYSLTPQAGTTQGAVAPSNPPRPSNSAAPVRPAPALVIPPGLTKALVDTFLSRGWTMTSVTRPTHKARTNWVDHPALPSIPQVVTTVKSLVGWLTGSKQTIQKRITVIHS